MFAKTILLLLIVVAVCNAKLQRITVKGRTICNTKQMGRVKIELREADTFDPDDTLATVHSDAEGFFEISGEEDEVGSIEPYLWVSHNCVDGVIKPECEVTDEYQIPKEYINSVYSMAFLNLNIISDKNTRKCL
uniref:Transthyretin-like family protein n=1 Tax=Syphacia muris TaxID=451379 RepID=A0A0N5AZD8_9BILA